MNYIDVDSVDGYVKKIGELGGRVVVPKMAVPGQGYTAVCLDTEGNFFGLWQDDKEAKFEHECESCGMPMQRKEDFGGGDMENKCCSHCCTPDGKLKGREEIKEGWIGYVMNTENISREEAEKKVDEQMAKTPVWG